jgi:hypothetical protein
MVGFFAVLCLMITALPVYAKTSDEIREEIEDLEEEAEEIRKELEELEQKLAQNLQEIQQMVQQKDTIDQQIFLLNEQITNTTEQIRIYNRLVADQQDALLDAQDHLEHLNEKYKDRIQAMEEGGKLSYWSVLFKANSFAELLDRIQMIREIAEADQRRMEELAEAAIYYRDKANELALQVNRNSDGNVDFSDFDTLANQAGNGFTALTYDYSYPIFAGCKLPVKQLGWADWYTSQGITGVTVGLTGEAAVNPQIPDVCLPFVMSHEMAHRMCIATEIDGDFAAFLACQANDSLEFRYSGYFMAYYYCYQALTHNLSMEATAAAARVSNGVSELLYRDITQYDRFFSSSAAASGPAVRMVAEAQSAEGTPVTVKEYDDVSDLLVAWHIQTVVLPSITVDERAFDPMDENQVDLTGIVNAVIGEG